MKTIRSTGGEGQQLELNLAGDPTLWALRPTPVAPARVRWWLQHIHHLIARAAAAGVPARPQQVELNLPPPAGKGWRGKSGDVPQSRWGCHKQARAWSSSASVL